jgi:hypothetical protein
LGIKEANEHLRKGDRIEHQSGTLQ